MALDTLLGLPLTAAGGAGVIVSDQTVRLALTGGILAGTFVLYRAIHSYDEWAERYLSPHGVKASQGVLGIVVMLVGGGLLVGVWGGVPVPGSFALADATVTSLAVSVGLLIGAHGGLVGRRRHSQPADREIHATETGVPSDTGSSVSQAGPHQPSSGRDHFVSSATPTHMTDQVVDDAVALVHRDISLIIHEERNPILAAQRTGFVASPAVPYLTAAVRGL
jgi:hypothetical protein